MNERDQAHLVVVTGYEGDELWEVSSFEEDQESNEVEEKLWFRL